MEFKWLAIAFIGLMVSIAASEFSEGSAIKSCIKHSGMQYIDGNCVRDKE